MPAWPRRCRRAGIRHALDALDQVAEIRVDPRRDPTRSQSPASRTTGASPAARRRSTARGTQPWSPSSPGRPPRPRRRGGPTRRGTRSRASRRRVTRSSGSAPSCRRSRQPNYSRRIDNTLPWDFGSNSWYSLYLSAFFSGVSGWRRGSLCARSMRENTVCSRGSTTRDGWWCGEAGSAFLPSAARNPAPAGPLVLQSGGAAQRSREQEAVFLHQLHCWRGAEPGVVS
ncbi:hypothetical protein DL769_010622 [Monosporascus sp. CRB-8-3]|nr:hypothetical protein DL769_010622 [Monosporascus sp. CRB-8-3]